MKLFFLIMISIVGYLAFKRYLQNSTSSRSRRESDHLQSGDELPNWLQERWDLARHLGSGQIFPAWYFDEMTEFQAKRLEEDGRKYSGKLTKGQASDLIGLGEPPERESLEILRFFKKSLNGINETRARHEIALLFQEEANRKAWADRPATTRQREFFRLFDLKLPVGLLKREADQQIAEYLRQSEEKNDSQEARWQTFENILDDFDDPDFRESFGIKKPSTPAIRRAIDTLLTEGRTWDDLDSDSVAEHLLETNPNLER